MSYVGHFLGDLLPVGIWEGKGYIDIPFRRGTAFLPYIPIDAPFPSLRPVRTSMRPSSSAACARRSVQRLRSCRSGEVAGGAVSPRGRVQAAETRWGGSRPILRIIRPLRNFSRPFIEMIFRIGRGEERGVRDGRIMGIRLRVSFLLKLPLKRYWKFCRES